MSDAQLLAGSTDDKIDRVLLLLRNGVAEVNSKVNKHIEETACKFEDMEKKWQDKFAKQQQEFAEQQQKWNTTHDELVEQLKAAEKQLYRLQARIKKDPKLQ